MLLLGTMKINPSHFGAFGELMRGKVQSFDILHPGVWFGPELEKQEGIRLKSVDELGELQFLCEHLKCGDFSIRSRLQELIVSCRDASVRKQAIRLYCYTARHQDVAFVYNLLEELDHDDILTVVVTAPDTLSPEVVPYLFTLLGEYGEVSISQDILSSIDRVFPWGYVGGEVDLIGLSEKFSGFAKSLVTGAYYYGGALAHPGSLCKALIEAVAQSRHSKRKFPLANAPTLLSVWSGEKCPVFYGQDVDDRCMQDVMGYVNRIASLQWDAGRKYFYKHIVE
ncbi:Imm47 family immunity protein [Pseudomonas sp. QS1027]|uniref:Imm47 family immunity protein n=1 Tax=Pseudomonas sp. QS1027 TaxID=2056244 RepID=UPI0012FDA965|nr:Imm47 family immunity protein [Pseudomonas sp. QS1027]